MRASLKNTASFCFGDGKKTPVSINTSEFTSQKRKQHKTHPHKMQEYEEAQVETIPDHCLIAAPPSTTNHLPTALGKLFQFGT